MAGKAVRDEFGCRGRLRLAARGAGNAVDDVVWIKRRTAAAEGRRSASIAGACGSKIPRAPQYVRWTAARTHLAFSMAV